MTDPLSILAAARRRRLRLLRLGLRRAAPLPHRVRGRHAARALPLAGRRGLRVAERRGRGLRVIPDAGALREALAAAGADGWLLYAFHGLNPVATRVLELERAQHPPAVRAAAARGRAGRGGAPDRAGGRWTGFPGRVLPYARWEELHAALGAGGPGEAARDGDLARGRGALPRPGAGRRGRAAPPAGRDRRPVGAAGEPVRRRLDRRRRRRTTARAAEVLAEVAQAELARAVRRGRHGAHRDGAAGAGGGGGRRRAGWSSTRCRSWASAPTRPTRTTSRTPGGTRRSERARWCCSISGPAGAGPRCSPTRPGWGSPGAGCRPGCSRCGRRCAGRGTRRWPPCARRRRRAGRSRGSRPTAPRAA